MIAADGAASCFVMLRDSGRSPGVSYVTWCAVRRDLVSGELPKDGYLLGDLEMRQIIETFAEDEAIFTAVRRFHYLMWHVMQTSSCFIPLSEISSHLSEAPITLCPNLLKRRWR